MRSARMRRDVDGGSSLEVRRQGTRARSDFAFLCADGVMSLWPKSLHLAILWFVRHSGRPQPSPVHRGSQGTRTSSAGGVVVDDAYVTDCIGRVAVDKATSFLQQI